MIKRIKQLILMFTCVLFSSQSCFAEPIHKNVSTNSIIEDVKVSNSKIEALSLSKEWQELCKGWKKLGKLSDYSAIESMKDNFSKHLDNLTQQGFISQEENKLLNILFSERLSHLQRQNGQMTCYRMTLNTMKIAEKREDLENRYKILEKLFNENKISETTFNESKSKIEEDLSFIDNYSSHSLKYTDFKNLTDIIIYLNK